MTLSDARGVATSATNPGSLEILETAVRQFQSYRGDAVETIDRALADDPDFVAGHIFRTEMHMMLWEKSVLPEVQASLGRLEALADKATERERAHIAAIADWAAGDWGGMSARLDRVVAEEPRDVVALQVGHLSDFFQGDRDNLRGRVARALPAYTREDPGYGFLLGMAAFGLEECGDYGAAEEAGRRAIALEPDDCWAQHALCHVMEMQARQDEGIAFMEGRRLIGRRTTIPSPSTTGGTWRSSISTTTATTGRSRFTTRCSGPKHRRSSWRCWMPPRSSGAFTCVVSIPAIASRSWPRPTRRLPNAPSTPSTTCTR